MIIVDVKNQMLGDSEFWRGSEADISKIANAAARIAAAEVLKTGLPVVFGMWHVRQEN